MTSYIWKGWRVHTPDDYVPCFLERTWVKILRGRDLLLIPFPSSFKDFSNIPKDEDEEWEFIGGVKTAMKNPDGSVFPVMVVVFMRR